MDRPPPGSAQDLAAQLDEPFAAQWGGWSWLRPLGLPICLLGVVVLNLLLLLAERLQFPLVSPSPFFMPLIAAAAYIWGARVGAVTAIAAFLSIWFVHTTPRYSLAIDAPGEWTRLTLTAAICFALVLLGDAARRLRRANQRLETIIASLADGILVVDPRGDLIQTNEAMRQMTGADVPRTLAERNDLWQTRTVAGTPTGTGNGPTGRALRGVTSTRSELFIRVADGRELALSVSSAPLRGRGGTIRGAVIVCRDITEVRRLQQAKDDFLSIASHELKTPLTALGGYAQLLRQRLARIEVADERSSRYLVALETQTRRMAELVNTLLDVSRLDAGRLQLNRDSCDLVALVREVAVQHGDLSEKHTIAIEAPPTLVGVWDADRIEQVVVNLLANAIRYSPDGGPIVVTVGCVDTLSANMPPPIALTAPAAFVRIQDRGLGIPPDQHEAIFDRFHRTHVGALTDIDARRGMGLGLYISREIVERHHGHIWATSPGPGQGATFTFTLPLSAPTTLTEHPL